MLHFDADTLNVLTKNIGGKYTIGEAVGLLGVISGKLEKAAAAKSAEVVDQKTTGAETHIVDEAKQPDSTEKVKKEVTPATPEEKKQALTSKEAALRILSRPNGVETLLFATKVASALKRKD
jgi:hypothetical protein